MTNQEEREKRFKEKFPFELWHEGGLVSKNNDILAFIQSEIDLALANRNKEIVEIIGQTQKTIRLEQFTVDTIINLITKDNE